MSEVTSVDVKDDDLSWSAISPVKKLSDTPSSATDSTGNKVAKGTAVDTVAQEGLLVE